MDSRPLSGQLEGCLHSIATSGRQWGHLISDIMKISGIYKADFKKSYESK